MYTLQTEQRPPVGSIISRPKAFFTHRGIYLGHYMGFDVVFENAPPGGVRIVSYSNFAQGHQVTVERQIPLPLNELLTRVQQSLRDGKPYDLFTYNCDHAVTKIADGVASSLQLAGWCLVAIVGGVLVLGSTQG